jgi:signal transduction histidine kinase
VRFVRSKPKLLAILWTITVIVFVITMFTASFFLTAYIYRLADLHPPILVVQVVNSVLGLFLTGLMIGGVTSYARSKGWMPELNVFSQIVEAMQQIAKGNFNVRLDNTFRANEPVSILVKGMNDMALELNAMEQLRQEFISNVSHEIQSPLTSIRGFAQALENDQLSLAERHQYLGIIQSESTRLSRITENLLKIAALESKQLSLSPKTYRLDKQIRGLVLACEPQWAAKELDMELCLDEIAIAADEDLLSQVWINLIHNGVKFTPPRGSVRIQLQQQGDQVQFEIADTGIGISEQDQARVFERFFKADPARTRSNGGSGLGLAISKMIVEMHRGTIAVASRPGAGTIFTVCLPAE